MDHDHDHGSTEDATAKTCPMIMVFHGGHCERILWRGWLAYTVTEFVLSALAIFAIAFLYEALKFLREHLMRMEARKVAERMALELQNRNCESNCSNTHLADMREKSYLQRIFGSPHLLQTLLNVVQVIISYFLMLIFMTFNYWLCLAVILGLGLGYFFFGWAKKDAQSNDCCP